MRSPRLALPFSVLPEVDCVRLVAGEDFRFTLRGPRIEQWLPSLLARCDGKTTLDALLASVDPTVRDQARGLIVRLQSERVLVEAPALDAHRPENYRLSAEGTGPLVGLLSSATPDENAPVLHVLCQDRLDFAQALRFNRERRRGSGPWLWVTTGPMNRAYVSPIFVPDAGPCLGCLLARFRALSPAPELYDVLPAHADDLKPTPFPEAGLAVLVGLVRWKLHLLAEIEPVAALYRLHVLEAATLEVSSHRLPRDPECSACGEGA
jgi:bacteriocin biosynthesis cyclodehydratase domain-containing protein